MNRVWSKGSARLPIRTVSLARLTCGERKAKHHSVGGADLVDAAVAIVYALYAQALDRGVGQALHFLQDDAPS